MICEVPKRYSWSFRKSSSYFEALRNSENKSGVFWGIENIYETTGISFDELLNIETNQ